MRNFQALELPLLALSLLAAPSLAASPFRETLSFSITTNVGFGNDVFVAGNHPDIGNWSPTRGVKLVWNPGNVWTGHVAIEAGTLLDYKFVSLPLGLPDLCNPASANWMPPGSGNHSVTSTPAAPPAPFAGKTMYYHSSWTSATVVFSVDGTNFSAQALAADGPGRVPGETLYRAAGFGVAGAPVQFVVNGYLNGTQYWDNAPYSGYGAGDYYTALDVFFLQDGDIYNYRPPPSASPPQILTSVATSTFAPSPNRTMKIYLPRGYAENTWKRYPVLYMHDGENVMPPYTGLGQWQADQTLTREISQGRMRETILVSLNSTANRTREYLPPEDNFGGAGFGHVYGNFLIHDVKARIDATYRTLTNRANTGVAGSSSGGLITTYLGWSTNAFGLLGSFSPAYLISPNFNAKIAADPKQPLRIYTDMGTDGSPENLLTTNYWEVLDHLIRDGYVRQADLYDVLACGAVHNEAAWAARFPDCARFLFPLTDEPNLLAMSEYPPAFAAATRTGDVVHAATPTLARQGYRIESAPTPDGPWAPAGGIVVELLPWSAQTLAATNPPAPAAIYRIVTTPAN